MNRLVWVMVQAVNEAGKNAGEPFVAYTATPVWPREGDWVLPNGDVVGEKTFNFITDAVPPSPK